MMIGFFILCPCSKYAGADSTIVEPSAIAKANRRSCPCSVYQRFNRETIPGRWYRFLVCSNALQVTDSSLVKV